MSKEKEFIKRFIEIFENLYKSYQKKYHKQNVAVFVSGGIDSSIIAYFTSKYFKNKNLHFLTLGGSEGEDFFYAKILNDYLKQKLIIINFNKEKIKKIKKDAIQILEQNNLKIDLTQISLASAFYLLCQKGKEEKREIIFTGQGPDVLLGGYHMYQNLPLKKLNQKIRDDLPLLQVDKQRDQAIANHFNIKLVNPYLEKEFVNFSLKIPPELKINKIGSEIYEKYLSRKVGKYLGLSDKIIFRHKKALQYSTKIRKYIK